MVNYSIDPDLLHAHLPHALELDDWQGSYLISLVGFMFNNTRVLGVRVPFHVDFEEINLRFYVRRRMADGSVRRGVVFRQEIVESRFIPLIANSLYGEQYVAMPTDHHWEVKADVQHITYRWHNGRRWNEMSVTAAGAAEAMAPDSKEEFIFEHYWGYSRRGPGRTAEYQVEHPAWQVYPVHEYRIDVDFRRQYGPEIGGVLEGAEPASVFLAEGSEIVVRAGGRMGQE